MADELSPNLLYDRRAKVTLVKPLTGSFTKSDPLNAIEVTDLRIAFKIEKKLQKSPNTAQIVLYNLSPQTRTFVEKKPLIVRLEAGFLGNVSRLWTGDLNFSWSKLDGVDWTTTLEVNNCERTFNYARTNRSFTASRGGTGTKLLDVLKEVGGSMELSLTMPPDVQAELSTTELKYAYSMRGAARDHLDKILKPKGLEWSLQDNQIQILRSGQVLRENQAHLVNQSTGMLGSPEYNAPKKPGESPTLKVKMLLYADLVPGQKIKVESRAINGVFRLEAVTHTGDTHSKEWFSELECKPVSTG